ncbi:MAG TPA: beta-ketoacyl-[acyl-carrier-protein] synthase family protein [Verrucomicrobiae bacterium]|nr:beta-ketoacyl-[acyl-carrier-protein] synthase family protein [Verrucomicrobiae bacterium]
MSRSILNKLLADNPIVITGAGSMSAAGDSVEALWSAAITGRSLAQWREFEIESRRGRFAVCSAPDLDGLVSEVKQARRMDRSVQLAWCAANQARNQACLSEAYPSERIGLIVGSSRGPLGKRTESFGHPETHQYPPSLSSKNTFGCISGALAQSFKLKGPGATISATCASAAFAIGIAAEQILLGKADAMLVGGAEAPLHFALLAQLDAAGVLGKHDEASQTCRPFDASRNGTVIGEGSAFLVLESARAAAARGVPALARLAGWEFRVDDSGRSGVREDGLGLFEVMREGLRTAGLASHHVDYINAHGTGTKMNDVAEAWAIHQLFGERSTAPSCNSTKPVTGHCLGATPALEAVLCVETLRRQRIPAAVNCLQPDPLCPVHPLSAQKPPETLTHVMSNSLGFWGSHAALIFSRA